MPPRKFTTSTANRKSRQSEITGLPFVKRRAKPMRNENRKKMKICFLRKPKARPRPIAIHQEHLSEVDKLLRQFDLNYTYGPCVGLTRLERWERAQALGLNPPQSVKDILLKDGGENQESLFHGQI
ncbi:DNA polymerase delta, subunit 4-domain-containing protein [Radiomyces spectabilis]|uniref:DNA polymerase delta, subunit 4-domain-containing protein n=1 Tax=Radiomyces spectabilis TaxID=64574 RepID=UPI002220DC13|nr:DNA polymerase delta, subunit 4-domain-containing protein [Radiomyces spectabilis]KAI8384674.1 DNA polymerase delta, subunit 4-domain-containing protein [Radiomyces spectabilis]